MVCAYFVFLFQTESLSVSQSSENDTSEIQVMHTFLHIIRKLLFSVADDFLNLFWLLVSPKCVCIPVSVAEL